MSHSQNTPSEGETQLPPGYRRIEAPSKFLEFQPDEAVNGVIGVPEAVNGTMRLTLTIGDRTLVLPSHSDLVRKLEGLPAGTRVYIRRLRSEKALKGGRTMYLYDVGLAEDDAR